MEIGVGGLNIEVATDNEGYLKDLMAKGLTKSNMRSFHWRNISEYRPQAKGIERAVGIAKEGIYTNWLAFETPDYQSCMQLSTLEIFIFKSCNIDCIFFILILKAFTSSGALTVFHNLWV